MKSMRYIYSILFLLTVSILLCGCPMTPYQTGSITVSITPLEAVSAGAKWRLYNGLWQDNGSTMHGLSLGEHAVSFKTVNG